MTVAESTGPEDTRRFGEELASVLQEGDVVLLHGDLGAGKTTMTQGILRGLGVTSGVSSPTFVLVAEHRGRLREGPDVLIRHADLYRLDDLAELESFGYADLIDDPTGIVIVEWPERAGATLPEHYLLVTIDFAGHDARRITVQRMG